MALGLITALKENARVRPADIALRQIESGEFWNWEQLDRASGAIARELRSKIPGGSTVILCAPNVPGFVAAFMGILRAGCKAFPLSPESATRELETAALRSGAIGLIGTDESIGTLAKSFAAPSIVISMRDVRGLALENDFVADTEDFDTTESALLLGSSGTTGEPKIVHRNAASLDAVCRAMCDAVRFDSTDQVLGVVPLCHSYGIEHGLFAPIWAASCVHLCETFEVGMVLTELRKGISIFPGVPFMFEALAQASSERTEHFPTLRHVYSAGAPLPPSVAKEFEERCGKRIGQIYGASEVGSVTFSDPESADFEPGSVGTPMAGVMISIQGMDYSGQGQVAIQAASMFDRYLGVEAPRVTETGSYLTGDLGRIDARGNLWITGRLKLLLEVGGQKVNPLEVEQVLCEHQGVAECVVVGMKLSETVTRLKAVVTARAQGPEITADALRRFAKSRLSPHKVPRIFEIRSEALPRSAAGKILRELLQGQE